MSSEKGVINAFQKVLPSFAFNVPGNFAEEFAQGRYRAKMEVPDNDRSDELVDLCWSNWLSNDRELPEIGRPHSEWYRARAHLHDTLGRYLPVDISFPKGSEFHPTRSQNSVEARLVTSVWTCTPSNFEDFSKICYMHKGLKRAVRRRYRRWFRDQGFDISERKADHMMWKAFRASSDTGFKIFQWKLERLVTFVEGSRFSTVPKNNLKRRPINIEPFGNIITQRAFGNHLRSEIMKIYGLDLDTLADVHRIRIKDVEDIATIDLKDASDSVSMSLCRFLLPNHLMKVIEKIRSPFVYGHDGQYHQIRKVSSMGNGFTFELMTLILLSVCRELDPKASVFGDDIIIDRTKADRLIVLLRSVGLKVNEEKSFVAGDFRESCGANYHKMYGYIESYDFHYPESIGDCILVWNKVVRLAPLYPSFKKLKEQLFRCIPRQFRGGPHYQFQQCHSLDIERGYLSSDDAVSFPLFFVTDKCEGEPVSAKLAAQLADYQLDSNRAKVVPGFEFKPTLRTDTLRHLQPRFHWGKYEMYLFSGRVTGDVLSGTGEWRQIWFVVLDGIAIRASVLRSQNQGATSVSNSRKREKATA